ncbi:hypothetical protein NDU88_006866 [Pleurodeles waltl]|uniref:Uncharacterized protein n=1 Tax=Pleurodeles waltl TaxID=8319 RepID=A0AAV7RQ07_PLEWA|nr:hypothetical protein NDU88_006866 [Pleurodeles waltl]
MFESPRGTPTRRTAKWPEASEDVTERRWFLGNPEKKERGRIGGSGENIDAGGDKNVDGEEAERVEGNQRKETNVDPGDVGQGRDKAGPEQLR